MNTSDVKATLMIWLTRRLDSNGRLFLSQACTEISGGIDDARFCQIIALASRHARREPLSPTTAERGTAASVLPGWDPTNWSLLEALRVALILTRDDLDSIAFAESFERFFRFADEGETCALYRAITFLPHGERYTWRAGEGCRTNMTSVFEAVACETPYPVRHFNDIAWRQLLMKALFIGVPLWRVQGLDKRLSNTIAHMFLDYVDERTSAGRPVPPDGWLLLGQHWSERADLAIESTWRISQSNRRAAALALARAGQQKRLAQLLARDRQLPESDCLRQLVNRTPTAAEFRQLLFASY